MEPLRTGDTWIMTEMSAVQAYCLYCPDPQINPMALQVNARFLHKLLETHGPAALLQCLRGGVMMGAAGT